MQKSGKSSRADRFKSGCSRTIGPKTSRNKHNCMTQVSYSQNFITGKKLINRIVQLSNIDKNDTVIEIGTGKGHLTEALCQKGGCVYSVEIDRNLYESTKEKLSHISNLRLIHGDFLNYSLPKKGDYKVFANIPYFITTQIVEKNDTSVKFSYRYMACHGKGCGKKVCGPSEGNGEIPVA